MGYVVIGDSLYGDPTEGSNKAVQDIDVRCEMCNTPAPDFIIAARWMCPTCHAVM